MYEYLRGIIFVPAGRFVGRKESIKNFNVPSERLVMLMLIYVLLFWDFQIKINFPIRFQTIQPIKKTEPINRILFLQLC